MKKQFSIICCIAALSACALSLSPAAASPPADNVSQHFNGPAIADAAQPLGFAVQFEFAPFLTAYAQSLPADRWRELISAVALAFAAGAYLPKCYRSLRAWLRHVAHQATSKWEHAMWRIRIICRRLRELFTGSLAINSATAEAQLEVGLPGGLSRTAVAARKAALVAAGTPPMYAEKFAIDAEQAQAWHDNPESREGAQANAKTSAETIAQGILDAHEADPSKSVKALSSKQLKERAEIVERVEAATEALSGARNDDDRTVAEQALAAARDALAQLDAA
jgi:hypothetical protein